MNPKQFHYLALGDSYTVGEMVPRQESFPYQAAAALRSGGWNLAEPVVIAKTGWTTDELQDAINKADIQRTYDFVTLLIGVNNQYRGRSVVEYSKEFEVLLKQAISFADGQSSHVFVLSIPDWGVTPFAADRNREQIAKEIDLFNQCNRDISNRYKVHYIDITPGTREAAADHSLVASDGLHPSGKEYLRWAAQLAAQVKKQFERR